MKILISGVGIAGSAAILFLHRDGHNLTAIDKAAAFHKLGYGLSLKSFGLSVMKELGLLDELLQRGLPMDSIEMRGAKGSLLQTYSGDLAAKAAQGATLVYRSDLHEVLYAAANELQPIHFGTTIGSIVQEDNAARVTLSDGTQETFDLLIVAEGVHSTSRELLWGNEGLRPFDIIYAAANVEMDHWAAPGVLQWYVSAGKNLAVIPVNERRFLIQSYFRGTFERDASNQ